MDKKQYVLLLVAAVVAGLVSGVVSSWCLMSTPVFVQQTPEQAVEKQPHQIAEVIRAKKFQVVNEEGTVLADLGLDAYGDLSLSLLDNDGEVRARLAIDRNDGAPRVDFYKKGNIILAGQLSFGLDKEGDPLLTMYDKETERGALIMSSTGLFVNRNGYGSLNLGVAGGVPLNRDKKGNVHPGAETNIGVHLELSDADHNLRAVLGQTDLEDTPTGTIEKRPASSLVLFGKNGKGLWQAP